jgi:hypothetical protein
MMAHACRAFDFANSGLENQFFNFVARYHLFRPFVLYGLEFNKTQVFALRKF